MALVGEGVKGRRELRRSETRHMKAFSGGIRIWSGTLIHPPGLGTEGEVSRLFKMALGGSGVWLYVPILRNVVGWCLVWGSG